MINTTRGRILAAFALPAGAALGLAAGLTLTPYLPEPDRTQVKHEKVFDSATLDEHPYCWRDQKYRSPKDERKPNGAVFLRANDKARPDGISAEFSDRPRDLQRALEHVFEGKHPGLTVFGFCKFPPSSRKEK